MTFTSKALMKSFGVCLGVAILLASTQAFAQGDSWEIKQPMPTSRAGPQGGAIDGLLYVAGGAGNPSLCPISGCTTLEVYDPSSDSWSTLAPMPTARSSPGAAVIGGRLYVAGGFDGGPSLTTLEAYDPGSDSWDDTLAPMPAGRGNPAVAAFGGQLFVFGGDSGGSGTTTVYVYDPSTDTWATKPAAIPAPMNGAAAAVIGNLIYLVGGTATYTLHIYNPTTDTWGTGAPMPVRIAGQSVGVIGGMTCRLSSDQ